MKQKQRKCYNAESMSTN